MAGAAEQLHGDVAAARAVLATVPLFKTLSAAEIDRILGHAVPQRQPRGAMIRRTDEPARGRIVIRRRERLASAAAG